MDKKIITIIGIIFALIFTASFLLLWNYGRENIQYGVNDFNNAYDVEGGWEYDLAFLENMHVTAGASNRFKTYMNSGVDVLPVFASDGGVTGATHFKLEFNRSNGKIVSSGRTGVTD